MTPHVDGRTDFDFLYGKWNIVNRRRRSVFQGCTEWQEFPATGEIEPVLGGIGHIDKYEAVFPDGTLLDGLTVRIFNPETQLWSLHWSDSRSCTLFPPVVGRFIDGKGEFHGTDSVKGTEIQVVFTWSNITSNSARWAQAFSLDNGATWEWNWEMQLTRIRDDSALPVRQLSSVGSARTDSLTPHLNWPSRSGIGGVELKLYREEHDGKGYRP